MNSESNKSLIRINNLLNKTHNAIFISNKLAYNGIVELFNEAFYLLNSKHLNKEAENFYLLVHNRKDYLKSGQFNYEANPHSNYEKAKDLFQKVIELDRTSKYCYLLLAITKSKYHISLEQIREAIEDCSKAIEIDLNFIDAYVLRGALKYEITDYNGSLLDFDKAIEINNNDSSLYFKRGETKCGLKKLDEAIVDYTKAIELNPHNFLAFHERAGLKQHYQDFKDAIEDYSNALELGIESSSRFVGGYYCRRQAMFELYFVTKIEELKNKFGTNSKLIKLLEDGKNNELHFYYSPKSKYNEVIALEPKIGITYICLANSYLLEDPSAYPDEVIIDTYTKAIEFDGDDSNPYLFRGDFYYEIKDYKNAIIDFNKAIEIEPRNTYLYFSLYLAYKKLGDINNSEKSLLNYKKMINANRSSI